jgi:hypothetical protein
MTMQGKVLPKLPDDDLSGSTMKYKSNTTSQAGSKSPNAQGKLQAKDVPTMGGKGTSDKSPPESPRSAKSPKTSKSPGSPKTAKDVASKPKGKASNERNSKGTEIDPKEAIVKAKEASLKAREDYQVAIADFLSNFIVTEVAVYKAPKVVKGDPKAKGTQGTQKPSPKGPKK